MGIANPSCVVEGARRLSGMAGGQLFCGMAFPSLHAARAAGAGVYSAIYPASSRASHADAGEPSKCSGAARVKAVEEQLPD